MQFQSFIVLIVKVRPPSVFRLYLRHIRFMFYDNRPNWNPLSPITITNHTRDKQIGCMLRGRPSFLFTLMTTFWKCSNGVFSPQAKVKNYFNNRGFQYTHLQFLIYQIAICGELFWKVSLQDSLYSLASYRTALLWAERNNYFVFLV